MMITSGIIEFNCILKNIFGICCPGCGLTRAYKSILQLELYSAFYYNILGVPLFIIGFSICIGLIIDIIKNKNKTINYILIVLNKYYIYIISFVIFAMIINNIKGI